MNENLPLDAATQATIATRLQDIFAENKPTKSQTQEETIREDALRMENIAAPSEEEAQDNACEIHCCRSNAKYMRNHFSTHYEIKKLEVSKLKIKTLQIWSLVKSLKTSKERRQA